MIGKIEFICLTCTKPFLAYVSAKRKYCSPECRPRIVPEAFQRPKDGDKNPNWRGGKIVDGRQGREMTYAPDDQNTPENRIYGYDYRLAAAKKLGRPLNRQEIVHHIDGDVRNNAPENLQVMTQSEHATLHMLARHAANRALQTHCKNGHPFNDENTIKRTDGNGRRCRICMATKAREYYLSHRDNN